MNIITKFKIYVQKKIKGYKYKKRIDHIGKLRGCVVFCKCGEPLNDISKCETLREYGIYRYTCVRCGTVRVFDFAKYPIPIYIPNENESNKYYKMKTVRTPSDIDCKIFTSATIRISKKELVCYWCKKPILKKQSYMNYVVHRKSKALFCNLHLNCYPPFIEKCKE